MEKTRYKNYISVTGRRYYMRSTHTLAVRSQQWIVEAMLHLLQKKKLQDITISALCDQANVSRRTFYRNFKNKNDVLVYYFSGLEKEYKQMLTNMSTFDFTGFLQTYAHFWKKHTSFLVSAKQDTMLFSILLQTLNTCIPTLYHTKDANQRMRYDIYFIIGGLHNVLMNWIHTDSTIAIEAVLLQLPPLLRKDISFAPNIRE